MFLRNLHRQINRRLCNESNKHVSRMAHNALSTSGPAVSVCKTEVMVDEKVRVTVTGLNTHQKISLLATQTENNRIFAACGHYVADDQGTVDTFVHHSHGGSYTGLDPTGLFTSIKEPFGTSRLMKRDVSQPFDVTLSIHDGHSEFEPLAMEFVKSGASSMTSTSLKRRYMAPGVKKMAVREGRLRGTLLLPPGKGPFSGIVDVFGMAGGLYDYRAALLASHGFAVFSLAYIAYDDLPAFPADLDLTYFVEAVDWLSGHPTVVPGGVGMIGHCFGGMLCQATSVFNPKVKVLVTTNSNPFLIIPGTHEYKGVTIEGVLLDVSKFTVLDEGVIQKDAFKDDNIKEHLMPIWKNDAKTLIVVGEEDLCVDANWHRELEDSIPPEKKDNFRFVYYPGAGHLIEPPYSPHCAASYNKIIDVTHLWGGDPKHHLLAQEKAWKEILTFLNTHLMRKAHL